MIDNLAIAQSSRPASEALARLHAYAGEIQTASTVQRAVAWVRARLMLDTRTSSEAVGVRSLGGAYRLLFSSDGAEIELLVESSQGSRRLEGELLPVGSDPLPRALVQLERSDGTPVADAQLGSGGRFAFDGVAPGAYRLWVVFAPAGPGMREWGDVIIDNLELA